MTWLKFSLNFPYLYTYAYFALTKFVELLSKNKLSKNIVLMFLNLLIF